MSTRDKVHEINQKFINHEEGSGKCGGGLDFDGADKAIMSAIFAKYDPADLTSVQQIDPHDLNILRAVFLKYNPDVTGSGMSGGNKFFNWIKRAFKNVYHEAKSAVGSIFHHGVDVVKTVAPQVIEAIAKNPELLAGSKPNPRKKSQKLEGGLFFGLLKTNAEKNQEQLNKEVNEYLKNKKIAMKGKSGKGKLSDFFHGIDTKERNALTSKYAQERQDKKNAQVQEYLKDKNDGRLQTFVPKILATTHRIAPLTVPVIGGKKTKAKAKPKAKQNKWITHVKEFSAKHNMKYNDAMKDPMCKQEYKK